jgi:hypothetical protein
MKPLNLREFAEQMLLGEHREFAIEILENIDFVDSANFEEIESALFHYASADACGSTDNLKKLEWIGDRSELLDDIEKELKEHKFNVGEVNGVDDIVKDLAETHRTIEGLLCDKGQLDEDCDVLEAVRQLLERVPQYDL